jgi:short-subunit dehydrogenase
MAVNVDGAFFMTQACVPFMLKKGWGRVVNMSSWAWKSGGLTAGTAYSTSKAAITGLTFSTARECVFYCLACIPYLEHNSFARVYFIGCRPLIYCWSGY